jgi:hypothetical protein
VEGEEIEGEVEKGDGERGESVPDMMRKVLGIQETMWKIESNDKEEMMSRK